MSVTLPYLNDPHLTADPTSARRLQHVLDLPPSRRPDAIVITGDIAEHGQPPVKTGHAIADTTLLTNPLRVAVTDSESVSCGVRAGCAV